MALLWLQIGAIFLALVSGAIGVFLPMCLPKSDCIFGHAMSGGVLFGVVMLHLLPEVIEGLGGLLTGVLAGVTFLALIMLEDIATHFFGGSGGPGDNHGDVKTNAGATSKAKVAAVENDTSKDKPVSTVKAICLLVGLSFHSVIEGFGIGTASTEEKLYVVAAALLSHKILAAFALGQTLVSTAMTPTVKYVTAIVFVLATPIGGAIGIGVKEAADAHANKVALVGGALAAGTFLQISAVEVIPHVLRLKGHILSKHLGLAFGFGLMAVLSASIGHGHEHGHGHGCEDEHNHGNATAVHDHGKATAVHDHSHTTDSHDHSHTTDSHDHNHATGSHDHSLATGSHDHSLATGSHDHSLATGSDHHHECNCFSDDTQTMLMIGFIVIILIASISSAVLALALWRESKKKKKKEQDTRGVSRPRKR